MAPYYSFTLISTPISPHRGEYFISWRSKREMVQLKSRAGVALGKTIFTKPKLHLGLSLDKDLSNWRTKILVYWWTRWQSNNKFAYQHPYYTFIKYLYIIQITDSFALLWRFFPWLNITCLIKYIYKSQSYWLGWSKDPGPPKAGMFPAIFIVGDASWRN